mmetsp:Transcript_8562/g.20232  ORF Transcript_8562/g.20232 Transcript_8562/m.20232 type:complete len:202 (-) Transcript_8562:1176-1781(-)
MRCKRPPGSPPHSLHSRSLPRLPRQLPLHTRGPRPTAVTMHSQPITPSNSGQRASGRATPPPSRHTLQPSTKASGGSTSSNPQARYQPERHSTRHLSHGQRPRPSLHRPRTRTSGTTAVTVTPTTTTGGTTRSTRRLALPLVRSALILTAEGRYRRAQVVTRRRRKRRARRGNGRRSCRSLSKTPLRSARPSTSARACRTR